MNPVINTAMNFTDEQANRQLTAITVVRVTLVIGLVMHTMLVILHIISFATHKSKFEWLNPAHRLRLFQALSATMMMIYFSMAVGEYYSDWRFHVKECYDMIIAHIFFYIYFKQFIDFFLYERAKVVHSSLRLNDRNMVRLRWGIWLSVAGLGPAFCWNALVVSYGPLILVDGSCNQAMQSVPTAIVLAIGDFCLGLAMLAIFVAPLRAHAKQTSHRENPGTKTFMRTLIVKNLVLSTVISLSGLTGILSYVIIFSMDWRNPENAYLPVWGYWAAVLDMMVGSICVHVLAKAWISHISFGFCANKESDHENVTSDRIQSVNTKWSDRAKALLSPGRSRIVDSGSISPRIINGRKGVDSDSSPRMSGRMSPVAQQQPVKLVENVVANPTL